MLEIGVILFSLLVVGKFDALLVDIGLHSENLIESLFFLFQIEDEATCREGSVLICKQMCYFGLIWLAIEK